MLVSEINAEIGNYAEIINTMSNLSYIIRGKIILQL